MHLFHRRQKDSELPGRDEVGGVVGFALMDDNWARATAWASGRVWAYGESRHTMRANQGTPCERFKAHHTVRANQGTPTMRPGPSTAHVPVWGSFGGAACVCVRTVAIDKDAPLQVRCNQGIEAWMLVPTEIAARGVRLPRPTEHCTEPCHSE